MPLLPVRVLLTSTTRTATEIYTFDPEGLNEEIDNGSAVFEYIYDANGQRLFREWG
jgi:hypothetical protein